MEALNELIIRVAEDMGLEARRYSGRGMYGKQCMGVVGDFQALMQLIGAVIQERADAVISSFEWLDKDASINPEERDAADDDRNELSENIETLLAFERDSMGLGTVIYWRNIAWEDEE